MEKPKKPTVTKIAMVVFFASVAVDYFTKYNLGLLTALAAAVAAVALIFE